MSMLLISLFGFLIYSNTYKAPFVFDDLLFIVTNDSIRNMHDALAGWSYMRFTGVLTFAINYRLGGLDSMGYHLFNLAVHVTNGILVFWLLTYTLRTPFFRNKKFTELLSGKAVPVVALITALLFVAHPIQTQAVTYTVQRFASLATLFYLLALFLYIKWRSLVNETSEGGKPRTALKVSLYSASLLSVLLAMDTKEIAVTLPAIVALWELSFQSGKLRKRLLYLLPYAAAFFMIPARLLLSGSPLLSGEGDTPVPPMTDYLFTQFRVIVTYLRLLVFPVNQNLDYDYPVYSSFMNPNVWLSFIFLVLIVAAGVWLFVRSGKKEGAAPLRLAAFGIFWFFITLSVESSFISIADVIFEHRVYLPSVGIFIAAITLLMMAGAYLKSRSRIVFPVLIALMAAWIGVLGFATYTRNGVWGSAISIWSDTAKKSPLKARPHINLGNAYLDSRQITKGVAELEQAVRLRPDYPIGLIALATAYQMNGQYAEADAPLQTALQIDPGSAEVHDHLGANYRALKQYDKAISEYGIATDINPDMPNAYFNLGGIYSDLGQKDKAMEEYQLAVQHNPEFMDAHNNLGVGYATSGEYDKAIDEFNQVIALQPDFAQAYNNLGLSYAALGDADKAEANFSMAIKLKSDYIGAYINLGDTLIDKNQYPDAASAFQKAIQLDTKNFEAHRQLGKTYALERQKDKALTEFNTALQIKPGDQEVTAEIASLQGS